MIIKQFKSGHPIGSSLDPSGPSGLVSRASSNQWPPPSSNSPWNIEINPKVKYEWDGQEWVMDHHELTDTQKVLYDQHFNDQRSQHFSRFPEESAACNIIRYRYAFELVIFWVSLPIIVGLVYLWRSSKRSSESPAKSNIATTSWLLLVVHSNITCYFWITYFIIDNVYICKNGTYSYLEKRAVIIAVIGAMSLGIAFLISAISAIRNDMYYPDAQMSPREAANFISHLKGNNPEMNIILKSHVRLTDHGHLLYDASTGRRVDISYIGYAGNPGVDDWKRPKKSFEPANWKDSTTSYPDIQELVACRRQPGMSNRNSTYFTQSLMLKITLSINPQTDNAGKDLNKCVFELARESGQREHQSWISLSNDEWEDIVEEKYKLHAMMPTSSSNSQFQEMNRRSGRRPLSVRLRGSGSKDFPMVTLEKPIFIYIVPTRVTQGVSTETSTGLPFFIRFAWILNLIGCSGLVLIFLSLMHYPTETLKIVKKYGCRRMSSESVNNNDSGSPSGNANVNTNPSNSSGLVVNLGSTTANPEEHIIPRRIAHHLLNHITANDLPMPPPYTSREPSILHHPMSPPPRYTSILTLDNVTETNQELHVNIPEEETTNNSDISETNRQPPSYQEAITSQNNPIDETKK